MLKSDAKIFLQLPDETKRRILHPGKVIVLVEAEERQYKAIIEGNDLGLATGLEFLVYYELKREFVKQGARIVDMIKSDDDTNPPVACFATTSDPASAESRKCYRISTAIRGLRAKVGEQKNCKLLDISITGFAIIASEDLKIGSIVPVTLNFDDEEYLGMACVQSVRELPDGATRYGLLCSEARNSNAQLKQGLRKMSTALQREQLRRMAGAA